MVVPDRHQLPVTPPRRRKRGGQVDVRAIEFLTEAKVLVDVIENLVGHGGIG